MKTILWQLLMLLSLTRVNAQTLKTIYVPADGTVHIQSPEPIQYVDISSKAIAGDLPMKNLLRLKLRDSVAYPGSATVTIAGEGFIVQYLLKAGSGGEPNVQIMPDDMRPMDISGTGFTQPQLRQMAFRLFSSRPEKHVVREKAFGLEGRVNHVYTAGDYVFLDVSYRNNTNLRYDIDELRFKVEDRKVTKAANNQSVEIKPEVVLFNILQFDKSYRNIFVLRKISFPGNKKLSLTVSEKPISGRVLTLDIAYQDILDADVIPL